MPFCSFVYFFFLFCVAFDSINHWIMKKKKLSLRNVAISKIYCNKIHEFVAKQVFCILLMHTLIVRQNKWILLTAFDILMSTMIDIRMEFCKESTSTQLLFVSLIIIMKNRNYLQSTNYV